MYSAEVNTINYVLGNEGISQHPVVVGVQGADQISVRGAVVI